MTKKELEKQNVLLRKCIEDTLSRLLDYDGYATVKGLKHLVDMIEENLISGYPEKVFDYEDREVCPVCFRCKEK